MNRGALGILGMAAVAVALVTPARAEDTPSPTKSDAPDAADTADSIIVTATRREARLSTVPVAVSVATAEALRNSGASDIRQLAQISPSLLISATGSDANAVARIRGVGTVGDNPGLESSVGLFIDGVYRPRTGVGLTELGDIERIEVLRGPQGTLFGRNSVAGLLNIVTAAPEFSWGGSGEASFGNYHSLRAAARLTGPLTDSLAFSIEGVGVRRDGTLDEVNASGAKVGTTDNRNRYLLRGQLLYQPDDALSVRLIADYSHRDESCCGAVYDGTAQYTGTSPANAVASPANRIVGLLNALGAPIPADGRDISITPGRDYVSRLRDGGVSAEVDYWLASGAKLTSITAWRDYKSADYGDYDYSAADLLYRDPGTYRQFITVSQELRAQGTALGGRIEWLGGLYYAHETLTLRDDIRFGADYGRFAACRLLGGAGAPNCTQPAVLGGLSAQLSGAGLPASAVNALTGGLTTLGRIGDSGDVDNRYVQRSETAALFTNNVVHVTSRLDVTIGLRYSYERKSFSAQFQNDNSSCPALQARTPGAANDLVDLASNPAYGNAYLLAAGILTLGCLGNSSTSLDALTLQDRMHEGRLSGHGIVSWKASDRAMLYASYARSYKSGGYNLDRFELGNSGTPPNVSPVTYFAPRSDADAASLRFGAEAVDAFEVGLKYATPRFTANIAAFREAFSNFQLNTFNGTSFVVQNIEGCAVALSATGTCSRVKAGLVSQGVELELTGRPRANVTLTGGVTYTDAHFADRLTGGGNGSVPLDPALFLLPGNTASGAPRIVATASMGWTPPIGKDGLSALFYCDARANGAFNSGSDLYPEKRQSAYVLVNARIGLRGPQARWGVELWAQNLLDTQYAQVIFSSPLQSSGPNNQTVAQLGRTYGASTTTMVNQLFSAFPGEPRTYGLTVKGRF